MRIRIPSKKVCERFFIIYELKGCQEAVNFLSRHYGIRRMRVIVDGRRTGKGNIGCYVGNKAYCTKRGLNKVTILHEFAHHLVDNNGLDLPFRIEERQARNYARRFLRNRS